METIKGYHDLYLEYDVLLLADVFEKFRNRSYYLSPLALSWDAMSIIGLDLISYVDFYLYFEKGMRCSGS